MHMSALVMVAPMAALQRCRYKVAWVVRVRVRAGILSIPPLSLSLTVCVFIDICALPSTLTHINHRSGSSPATKRARRCSRRPAAPSCARPA